MFDRTENAAGVFSLLYHVNSDPKVTPTARSVFLWLTYHLPNCYPSLEQLARLTGFTKKTVNKAIQNLEATGYIEVSRRHRENNDYTVMEREKFDYKAFVATRKAESKQYAQDKTTRVPGGKTYPQAGVKLTPNVVSNLPPNHCTLTTELKSCVADATARVFSAEEFAEEGDEHPGYEIVQREDGTLAIDSGYGPSQSEAELVVDIQDTVKELKGGRLHEDTAATILETLRLRLAILRKEEEGCGGSVGPHGVLFGEAYKQARAEELAKDIEAEILWRRYERSEISETEFNRLFDAIDAGQPDCATASDDGHIIDATRPANEVKAP
jgi:biotin operon repressor